MSFKKGCLIPALGAIGAWLFLAHTCKSYTQSLIELDQERQEKVIKELQGRDDVIVEGNKIIAIDEVRHSGKPPKTVQSDTPSASKPAASKPAASKPAASTPAKTTPAQQYEPLPEGVFKVNVFAQSGSNKQIRFMLNKRDKNGKVTLQVKEFGGQDTHLGGMTRFNVILWDPAKPNNKGLAFQMCLNDSQGLFLLPYDQTKPTVYLTPHISVCAELKGKQTVFSAQPISFKGSSKLREMTLEVPEKFYRVSPRVQEQYMDTGRAVTIPAQPASRTRGSSR